MNSMIVPSEFYQNPDVVDLAKKLLGKVLYTNFDGNITAGKIVETEAYSGFNDMACHANNGQTNRNKIMFDAGGKAYVYLCYGIHHMFNVVCNVKDRADAVLVRAIEPVKGIEVMAERRKQAQDAYSLTSGPGKLSQALGIKVDHNMSKLEPGGSIWIENSIDQEDLNIQCSPRIGVGYAKEDAWLPWRFYLEGNKYLSKGKTKYF